MSTIKISELEQIQHLNSNTANTLLVGVDIPSGVTGKITATTLAEGLYSYNALNVGNNEILFPNTVAQFSGNSANYLQVNLQNFDENGTGDYIVTADVGSDLINYVDLGITNSTYDPTSPYNSLGSAVKPLDSYLYSKGDVDGSGNFIIGTVTKDATVNFIVGGVQAENVSIKLTSTGLTLNTGRYITFDDNSKQYTAVSNNWVSSEDALILSNANLYTDSANTQLKDYTDGEIVSANNQLKSYVDGEIVSANTQLKDYTDGEIVSANTQLKSYVDGQIISANTQLKDYTDGEIVSANNQLKSYTDGKFLANTSNTLFNGTLNIGDKLNVNGSVIFANTQFTATQAALTIAACPIGDIQLPSNDGYMLHISGKQDVASRIVFDSYGANTYAVIAGRTARGTPTAPQAVQNGDVLMRISGNGYGTTKFSTLGSGRIDITATENFTDDSRSTQIQFYTTVAGTNTQTQIATFNGASAVFNGVVNPQKGLMYTPNVLSGITNTLNIDIANNSLYKFTCDATTTINLSGYATGKIIEVWITNVDNNNHTVTHGCTANNSTIGQPSFTLTSKHSAYLRYFSIDGDNANTFVSITYS